MFFLSTKEMSHFHANDARRIPAKETIFARKREPPSAVGDIALYFFPYLLPLSSSPVISQPPGITVPSSAQRQLKASVGTTVFSYREKSEPRAKKMRKGSAFGKALTDGGGALARSAFGGDPRRAGAQP